MRPSRSRSAALAFALAAAARAADPEAGRLTERVVCRERPEQAYALFLPSAYAADRPAPILYLLDARGRGLAALEPFRAAAETYGWIVASSYNSRSDTRDDPNTPALQAMWNDTHAKLSIDPRRVYVGGFSGGARAAVALAFGASKSVAGVIGCGAGFPDGKPSWTNLPFAYFGTAGVRDFNYYEMRTLDVDLRTAHRIEFFDGGHDWPPPAVARKGVAWMEIAAMRTGSRPSDPELASRLFAEALAEADALASEGRRAEASVRYAHAAEDFRGLTDVEPAAKRAESLGADADVRKSLRDASRRDDRDRTAIRTLSQKLHAAIRDPDIPAAAALAAELGIPSLKHRAAAGSPEERLSAERILANLRVETSFYLPEDLLARGDSAHARLTLSVAAHIDPDDPRVDYDLASVEARSGRPQRARRELERAVEKGFRRFELLEQDPDFESLRRDPDFQKWLARERARAGGAGAEAAP